MPEQTELGIRILGDAQRLMIEDGDIIILQVESVFRPEFKEKIMKNLEKIFKGHTVLVLDGGIKLSVVSIRYALNERDKMFKM